MADQSQIDRAFQQLGSLYAAEHAEHDDEGARQVGCLLRLLRKFKAHEQDEQRQSPFLLNGVREASYQLPDGRGVWYDAGDAIRDASDLYTVLAETYGTGSPNLENTQALQLVNQLQRGGGLGEMHISLLRRLMAKHQTKVDALRRKRDRDGQDLLDLPDGGASARIINQGASA